MSVAATSAPSSLDFAGRYRAIRERTRAIFRILVEDAYYETPISRRNPIVFYEGHLPAFAVNTLIKLGLRRPGIDDVYESLFARGIDPASEASAKRPTDVWPARSDVQRYAARAEEMVTDALREDVAKFDDVAREAVNTILEHEVMHQETLLYMFHQLPHEKKRKAPPLNRNRSAKNGAPASAGASRAIKIPEGAATLGARRDEIPFAWDNEFPSLRVDVAAFEIDRLPVNNGDYLEYINQTGAEPPHFWLRNGSQWLRRDMFESVPLPLAAPVFVTKNEAAQYARWKGMRLPTEPEYHRAAFGSPSGEERQHPWGDSPPTPIHGNFDFVSWDPIANGSHPEGASAWGVEDLVGNGWEWTSTPFGGFPGFTAMPTYPQYSADFFDSAHFVLKGASPATGRELIRRSFRNWFRPDYPYVYAKFRCVK